MQPLTARRILLDAIQAEANSERAYRQLIAANQRIADAIDREPEDQPAQRLPSWEFVGYDTDGVARFEEPAGEPATPTASSKPANWSTWPIAALLTLAAAYAAYLIYFENSFPIT